jgi:transposase
MAYSIDFRKRAIAFMNEGHTYKELYEAFKIYPSTIEDWRKLLEESGSLEPQYDKRDSSRKIDLSKLEQAIKEKPDAYLDELAQQFGCTKQAIFYAQKRLEISYKKNSILL